MNCTKSSTDPKTSNCSGWLFQLFTPGQLLHQVGLFVMFVISKNSDCQGILAAWYALCPCHISFWTLNYQIKAKCSRICVIIELYGAFFMTLLSYVERRVTCSLHLCLDLTLCFLAAFIFCLSSSTNTSCQGGLKENFFSWSSVAHHFSCRCTEAGGLRGQTLDKWSKSLWGMKEESRVKEWKDICCVQRGQRPCHLDKPTFFSGRRPLEGTQSFSARIKTMDWEAHLMPRP